MSKEKIKVWKVTLGTPNEEWDLLRDYVVAPNYKDAGEKVMRANKGMARYVKCVELEVEAEK